MHLLMSLLCIISLMCSPGLVNIKKKKFQATLSIHSGLAVFSTEALFTALSVACNWP
jgi:hypothetical protein